jgi:hypothetical protein
LLIAAFLKPVLNFLVIFLNQIFNLSFLGYNATVLAYGQTGSGKTHSMGTCTNQSTPLDLEGVIPRAVREIFARMNSMDYEFNICVTFVELYKEQLYDLLSTQVGYLLMKLLGAF